MEVQVKVIGKELYRTLAPDDVLTDSIFSYQLGHQKIDWQVQYVPTLAPEILTSSPDTPEVLLIEIPNEATVETVHALEKMNDVRGDGGPRISFAKKSVILVFQPSVSLSVIGNFPAFISDWIISPVLIPDLERRVFRSLKLKNILRTSQSFGSLTFIPESRYMFFEGRNTHLTPSEAMLAEHFFGHLGSVVPFSDLVMLFRAAGKSVEANNIRVALFQLRLKLEMLTKSNVTVTNVYRQGYSLRQNAKMAAIQKKEKFSIN